METTDEKYAHIPGWGMDADPENDPAYPMKKYNGADHERLNYERPPVQPETVEVLHSNERPDLTRVMGTSVPPSGLSGALRRKAFTFSESNWGHWLSLIAADRINVIEGIIADLKAGTVPDLFTESGLKARWKYDRRAVIRRAAVTAACVIGITAALSLSARKKRARG
jgi:hypothetical protein